MNTTLCQHIILVPCCHRGGAAPPQLTPPRTRWIAVGSAALGLIELLVQLF